jgi:hypothetical protein
MTYDELMAKFLATPEAEEWDDFVVRARQGIAESGDTITVPSAFLKRVIDEIATSPLSFAAYQDVWNRLCDEYGQPEFKTGQGSPETEQEGPF